MRIALCFPSATLLMICRKAVVKSKPAAHKGFSGLKLQKPINLLTWLLLNSKLSSLPQMT